MYDRIVQAVSVPLAVVNVATQRFVWANPVYCQLLGRSIEELKGLTWIDVTDKSSGEALLHQGQAVVSRKRYLTKTGAVDVQVRITVLPMNKALLERDHKDFDYDRVSTLGGEVGDYDSL